MNDGFSGEGNAIFSFSGAPGIFELLPWPLQVPSTIKWPEGATSDTLLICPNDSGSYDAPKLVEFYLKYWDRKSISFIGGRFQSSHASVVEAFSEQFQDCAKAEKK